MTHEELWLHARPRLEAHLLRSHSRSAVEDIVDEAFVRLKGQDADPEQLWQTAFWVEKEYRRAEARQAFLEEQADILTGRAIPSIETAILRADFDRAFRRLPRPQQEAFALIELRGLTEQEAAGVLGIPKSTVNWRCEAARSRLKEELT